MFKIATEYALTFELTTNSVRELNLETKDHCLNRIEQQCYSSNKSSTLRFYQKPGERNLLKNNTGQQTKSKLCYRCNGDNHTAKNCKYINYNGNECHKVGHLQQTCKTSGS
jgi:hypothetical protein